MIYLIRYMHYYETKCKLEVRKTGEEGWRQLWDSV